MLSILDLRCEYSENPLGVAPEIDKIICQLGSGNYHFGLC